MIKNVWVGSTLTVGIILCVFGNAAFAAMGVVLGLFSFGAGGYFLYCYFSRRRVSFALCVTLLVAGLLLIILCLFVEYIAFFLGGIIMLAAGIILLPTCRHHHRLVAPFCAGCMIFGVVTICGFGLVEWMAVLIGIALIIYSGLVLMFAY